MFGIFGVGEAFAQSGGGAQGVLQGLGVWPVFILMFAVMYFLMIRPQHKKQKQHQAMIDDLKKGDKVVTTGGMHGTIVGVKEKEGILMLQVAKDVRVEIEAIAVV